VRPNGVAAQALEPGISAKNRLKPLTMALIWRVILTLHSGMVRKHQTRNLEIPGSMPCIAPE